MEVTFIKCPLCHHAMGFAEPLKVGKKNMLVCKSCYDYYNTDEKPMIVKWGW